MIRAPLVGRRREIEGVRARLDEGARLITLHGPPGAGKSRVLARIGELSERRAIEVSIGNVDETEALVRVAAAVGVAVRSEDLQLVRARVADELERREALLLLDDADVAASLVESWLDAAPHAQAVVTARALLAIDGEIAITIDPLPRAEAIALLRDRISRRSSRALDDESAWTIVERVDRLPLAIELLAPRVAMLGLEALPPEPANAFDPLRRALDAALELPPDLERALASAAVFEAPFDLEAARAVIEVADVEGALVDLGARSLLRPSDDGRFSMLRLVRSRVLSRPAPPGLRERHARHFAGRALAIDPHSNEGHSRRAAASEDLLVAFDRLSKIDEPLAARLAVALDPLLVTRGPPALHAEVLTRALAFAEGSARADLLRARGRFAGLRGSHRAAAREEAAALSIAESIDDPSRAGWTLAMLCFSHRALGNTVEARAAGERARALAGDDLALEAMAEQALGLCAAREGEHDAALAHHRRAAAAARRAGAPRLLAIALANAGNVHRALGAFDDAEASFSESTEIFRRIGDRFHEARVAVDALANTIAQRPESADESTAKLLALLPALEEADDREGQHARLLALADAARAVGDLRRAELHLDDAEILAGHLDDPSLATAVESRRAALRHAPEEALEVAVARDGRSLRMGGRTVDLGRRGAIRRVLVALVERRLQAPSSGLSVADILAAGWPGERMRADSGSARVYMAIRTLRSLGLEGAIITRDDGYLLDPSLRVAWF
jgi:tetratricopeptide (TPR) repeat protein